METTAIIAYLSLFTSIAAVILSSFIAPRMNAWFDKQNQNKRILKKTLRTLLEAEQYVHRNLPHPSIPIVCDTVLAKVKERSLVPDGQLLQIRAGLPKLFELLQPHIVENFPDRFDEIDKEFHAVLDELATVDPILAFQISERHVIGHIQKLNTLTTNMLNGLGVEVSGDDQQVLEQLSQTLRQDLIDQAQSDLRTDILNGARRIGRQTLNEINDYFAYRDAERKRSIEQLMDKMLEMVHQLSKPIDTGLVGRGSDF